MSENKQKPVLVLKPFENEDKDTERIYNLTSNAIELLNNYVLDYFESIEILCENKERSKKKSEQGKYESITENIIYIETKIVDITEEMKRIAEEMSDLIKFQFHDID